MGYDTAKAILVDGDAQAAMQAFLSGRIKVEGDVTKMIALQTAGVGSGADPSRHRTGQAAAGDHRLTGPRPEGSRGAAAPAAAGDRYLSTPPPSTLWVLPPMVGHRLR